MQLTAFLIMIGAACAVAFLLEETGPSVAKMETCLSRCDDDVDCQSYCLTVRY